MTEVFMGFVLGANFGVIVMAVILANKLNDQENTDD